MKILKYYLGIVLLKFSQLSDSQRIFIGNWSQIRGSDQTNQAGNYGPISALQQPGSRHGHTIVLDADNRCVYQFGGEGYATDSRTVGYLNDLWRFDLVTKLWKWISGSSQVDQLGTYSETPGVNVPGGRYRHSMAFDSARKIIFVFSGRGAPKLVNDGGTMMNDLWSFDVVLQQWTCLSGVNSLAARDKDVQIPSQRMSSALIFNPLERTLIVFGGQSSNIDFLNDVWRFDLATQKWSLLSGPQRLNQLGSYGNTGTQTSYPGSRSGHSFAFDTTNRILYVFGGYGYGKDAEGYLNDLWMYQVQENSWTWIGGSNIANPLNQKEVILPRSQSSLVFDPSGFLILFGGVFSGEKLLNDMWTINLSTNDTASMTCISGCRNTDLEPTKPGIRESQALVIFSPTDSQKFAFVFGGNGVSSNGSPGLLNDLWEVQIFKEDLKEDFKTVSAKVTTGSPLSSRTTLTSYVPSSTTAKAVATSTIRETHFNENPDTPLRENNIPEAAIVGAVMGFIAFGGIIFAVLLRTRGVKQRKLKNLGNSSTAQLVQETSHESNQGITDTQYVRQTLYGKPEDTNGSRQSHWTMDRNEPRKLHSVNMSSDTQLNQVDGKNSESLHSNLSMTTLDPKQIPKIKSRNTREDSVSMPLKSINKKKVTPSVRHTDTIFYDLDLEGAEVSRVPRAELGKLPPNRAMTVRKETIYYDGTRKPNLTVLISPNTDPGPSSNVSTPTPTPRKLKTNEKRF